jgi:hypothetical protein
MKKLFGCFLLLTFIGCASITIPSYIQDKNPYQKTFYAPFDDFYKITMDVFREAGWMIEKEYEPTLFERERDLGGDRKQTLLFTEIRQSYFFIGSGYSRMNVFLREKSSNETEIEIRYVKVTSMMFKCFYGYRNDSMIDRIFKGLEERLDTQPAEAVGSGS